ncbi:MAG: hypothetical protein OSB00_08170 [Sphingomonas bacterium]|nr:hypothetical protein [Sphingomonas bacterium]
MSQTNKGTDPQSRQIDRETDDRPDIEQVVESRSDAVERGEGGPEPDRLTAPGMADGVGGTGGRVKNQDDDAR